MDKIVTFYKKHYELINYIVLTLLLAVSCFVKNFVYVAVGFAMFVSLFYNVEKNLKIYLYLTSFQYLFYQTNFPVSLHYLVILVPLIKTTIIYIIDLIKKRKKINLILLIILALILLYIALPIHIISISDFVMFATFMAMIYLMFEYKDSINYTNLILILCAGIYVSVAMFMLKFCSPYLNSIIPQISFPSQPDYVRFQALTSHPNVFASTLIIAMSGLSFLFYAKKIKFWQFLLYFLPLYVFGILTISRMFVVAFAVLVFVFILSYLIKNKKKAIKPLLIFALCLVICSACLFYQIWLIVDRASEGIYFSIDSFDEDTLNKILSGEVYYDPGRIGIWKLYLKDWSSSIKTILFGRGISCPAIGQMFAHNIAIQLLWYYGVFGYILFFALFVILIRKLNIKNVFILLLLPFLPIATSFLLDPVHPYQKYILIILLITILTFASKPNKEVLTNGK